VYHFVTSWTAATRAELRLSPFRAPDRTGGNLAGERARGHPHSSTAAGMSVRRVEDITDALWGTTRGSPSTVSNLTWPDRSLADQPIEGELDADRAVADRWAVGPLSSARLRIDVRRWDNRGVLVLPHWS
jgi:hypothetical protein